MGKLAVLFLLFAGTCFGYEIVLKDGSTIQGKLVRESAETIILKDTKGVIRNINKSQIKKAIPDADDTKTKPAGHVVTQEDLEKLREKYDLGGSSYGKFTELPESHDEYLDQDSEFDREVLHSTVPVLVEFWASWCGPCRQMTPIIDAVSSEFSGEAKVYKVNVDIRRAVTERYEIKAIPTILFFYNGKVTDQIVGSVPKETVVKKLRAQIDQI
jgi:thioredoxin 1